MPLSPSGAWTRFDGALLLREIQQEYAAQVDYEPDFDGTPEGALVATWAQLIEEQDARVGAGIAALTLDEAQRSSLDRIGNPRGLPRRPAVRSRWVVRAVGDGLVPAGTELRFGLDRWLTVEAVVAESAPGADLIIEAVEPGPVTLPQDAAIELEIVTPVDGLDEVLYDATGPDEFKPRQIGRAAEGDASYRARLRGSLAGPGLGGYAGLRAALLVPDWAAAASVTRGPGGVRIVIVPEPVGDDQDEELREALLSGLPPGVGYVDEPNDRTITLTLPGGDTETVTYYVGQQRPADVVLTLAVRPGLSAEARAQIVAAAEAEVVALVAGLDVGQPLRILDLLVAAREAGATGATATIDAAGADLIPPSTDIIVLDSLSVTAP